MSTSFRFRVEPGEDFDAWADRWDKEVNELTARGLTLVGRGKDNEEPLSIELEDPAHPDGPYTEVFGVRPL